METFKEYLDKYAMDIKDAFVGSHYSDSAYSYIASLPVEVNYEIAEFKPEDISKVRELYGITLPDNICVASNCSANLFEDVKDFRD